MYFQNTFNGSEDSIDYTSDLRAHARQGHELHDAHAGHAGHSGHAGHGHEGHGAHAGHDMAMTVIMMTYYFSKLSDLVH